MSLFTEAAELLRVALENMMVQGKFDERGVSSTLLQEHTPMAQEVSVQLYHMPSLSFDSSFSFSLAAILFKGMRHQSLKEAAGGALRSLLRISTRRKGGEGEMPPNDTIYYDSQGYFLALIPLSTTLESFKKLLEDADTNPEPPREPTPAKGETSPRYPSHCWEFAIPLRPSSRLRSSVLFSLPRKSMMSKRRFSTAFCRTLVISILMSSPWRKCTLPLAKSRRLTVVSVVTRTCTRGSNTYPRTARIPTL